MSQFQVSLTTADTQAFVDTVIVPLDFLISDLTGKVFTVASNTTLEIKGELQPGALTAVAAFQASRCCSGPRLARGRT